MAREARSEESWIRIAVYSAVFAALVFAATLIAVSTPVTEGYFNLGESMVYTAAILGGPVIGGIAGGVGSAMADLYLGYSHYAPGTLVIKGVEGFLVGWIYYRLSRLDKRVLRRLALPLALLVGGAIIVAGAVLYGAIYGGDTVLEFWGRSIEFSIPLWAWALAGLAVGLLILYIVLARDPAYSSAIIAMLLGGTWMVTGYFLYEAIVLGFGITAAAELPVNFGQALVGSSIAIAIVSAVARAGYDKGG
ncbi:MAG: ECF transporter S component [Desulfurococcales archaeon]|nr:ECF transporter S component [Desulfurococcales archaeon]